MINNNDIKDKTILHDTKDTKDETTEPEYVEIELDLEEEDFLLLQGLAKEKDITISELVEKILEERVAEFEKEYEKHGAIQPPLSKA